MRVLVVRLVRSIAGRSTGGRRGLDKGKTSRQKCAFFFANANACGRPNFFGGETLCMRESLLFGGSCWDFAQLLQVGSVESENRPRSVCSYGAPSRSRGAVQMRFKNSARV